MKTIWIYVKAFGLVMSRRFKRRMANKQNAMIGLGVAAALLLCVGGTCFLRTLTTMNALGVSASNQTATQQEAASVPEVAEQTKAETQTMESCVTEPEQIVREDMQSLTEEQVPLAVRPENEAAEIKQWTILEPIKSEASSVLQSKSGKSYDVENLLDNDETTTWQEGEEEDGIGTTLTFGFQEGSKVCGISVVNGNGISEEKYQSNNRVQEITVIVGEQKAVYTLEDHMGVQYIAFENETPCDEILIQINSVYEGSKYDDTSLSQLVFYTK